MSLAQFRGGVRAETQHGKQQCKYGRACQDNGITQGIETVDGNLYQLFRLIAAQMAGHEGSGPIMHRNSIPPKRDRLVKSFIGSLVLVFLSSFLKTHCFKQKHIVKERNILKTYLYSILFGEYLWSRKYVDPVRIPFTENFVK